MLYHVGYHEAGEMMSFHSYFTNVEKNVSRLPVEEIIRDISLAEFERMPTVPPWVEDSFVDPSPEGFKGTILSRTPLLRRYLLQCNSCCLTSSVD